MGGMSRAAGTTVLEGLSCTSWVHAVLLAGGPVCFLIFLGLMSACSLGAKWGLCPDLPGHHRCMQSCWKARFLADEVCFTIFLDLTGAYILVGSWGLFLMVQGCPGQLSFAHGTAIVSCSGGGMQWAKKWADHMTSAWWHGTWRDDRYDGAAYLGSSVNRDKNKEYLLAQRTLFCTW